MAANQEPDLVEALVVSDAGVLLMAKSLLESAGISYLVKDENAMSMFGWSHLGFWRPAVMVEAQDAEAARELLAPLLQPSDAPPDVPDR